MGISFFGKIWSSLFGDKEIKIVIVGLDNAGKTTTLYQFQQGEVFVTTPTLGSNVEEVTYKNIKFQMWDLGGQDSLRESWDHYYQGTQAIIFVIDSTDKKRMPIVKKELMNMLNNEDLKNVKLLIYANKQDLKDATMASEISDSLNLHKIKSHEWHMQSCCALSGSGLNDGLEWLATKLKE
eukprot:gene10653-3277_t